MYRHQVSTGHARGFIATIRDNIAAHRRAARLRWLRYTTERAIAELPPELRKDIGWPARYDC